MTDFFGRRVSTYSTPFIVYLAFYLDAASAFPLQAACMNKDAIMSGTSKPAESSFCVMEKMRGLIWIQSMDFIGEGGEAWHGGG